MSRHVGPSPTLGPPHLARTTGFFPQQLVCWSHILRDLCGADFQLFAVEVSSLGGSATRQWRTGFGETWTDNSSIKDRKLKRLLHTLDCIPMTLDIWSTLDKTLQDCPNITICIGLCLFVFLSFCLFVLLSLCLFV